MLSTKRKRGCNYTAVETNKLLYLVQQYQSVVDDKRTSSVFLAHKKSAWEKICTAYNVDATSGLRTVEQLKHFYDNLKQKARKSLAANNSSEIHNQDSPYTTENVHQESCQSPSAMFSSDTAENPSQSTISSTSNLDPRKYEYLQQEEKRSSQEELVSLVNKTMKKFCSEQSIQVTPEYSLSDLNDYEIAGVKYGRDLRSLEPQQRNFVEKLVADAVFYGKQGRLSEMSSLQLGPRFADSSCCRQNLPSTTSASAEPISDMYDNSKVDTKPFDI